MPKRVEADSAKAEKGPKVVQLNPVEEKAKKLLHLSGLSELVDEIVSKSITKDGIKSDVAFLTFKGANKEEATKAAKELIWWSFVSDKFDTDFDGYTLEVDDNATDSPIVYFYKQPVG